MPLILLAAHGYIHPDVYLLVIIQTVIGVVFSLFVSLHVFTFIITVFIVSILCAGVMALAERKETVDGLEMQIGVNHFGHHLLTRLMEPSIKDGGRIVFLSSIAHHTCEPTITSLEWDNVNFEKPGTYDRWKASLRCFFLLCSFPTS